MDDIRRTRYRGRAMDPEGDPITIRLPVGCRRFIDDSVRRGQYASPSEVVAAALRLLSDQEQSDCASLERFRDQVAEGVRQLDRGEAMPGEEVIAELRARIARRSRGEQ